MSEVDDIIDSLMGGAIIRHNTGTIEGKNNRDIHQTHIMIKLVISSLEKSRVDGNYRLDAA